MYSESPNTLSSMLCSVVSELPPRMQALLGLVCVGHHLTTFTNNTVNVFSISRRSLLESNNEIQASLEFLRSKWPISPTMDYQPILKRQVYLIRGLIDNVYSLPVQWDLPEVWTCWHTLQHILNHGMELLFQCSVTLKSRSFVTGIFCLLIVQIRWAFGKLCEIQQKDKCALSALE